MNNPLKQYGDIMTLKDVKEMREVSRLLDDNGIVHDVFISPSTVKVLSNDLNLAKSLLKGFAVEVVEYTHCSHDPSDLSDELKELLKNNKKD